MDFVKDEVSIHAVPNKYGPQSGHIKDFISMFEYNQQDRLLCDCLHCEIGHQSYTEW